ncbi:uncharacterized protein METZ01_LOCUS280444, partial [marine metagenome]
VLEFDMQHSKEVVDLKRFDVSPTLTGFIDGQSVPENASAEIVKCIAPTDETELTSLYEADLDEVDGAVNAARRAFESGPWPRMSIDERNRILRQISDKIVEHAEELAYLESINVGLPIRNVKVAHIPRAARNFAFFTEVARQA